MVIKFNNVENSAPIICYKQCWLFWNIISLNQFVPVLFISVSPMKQSMGYGMCSTLFSTVQWLYTPYDTKSTISLIQDTSIVIVEGKKFVQPWHPKFFLTKIKVNSQWRYESIRFYFVSRTYKSSIVAMDTENVVS